MQPSFLDFFRYRPQVSHSSSRYRPFPHVPPRSCPPPHCAAFLPAQLSSLLLTPPSFPFALSSPYLPFPHSLSGVSRKPFSPAASTPHTPYSILHTPYPIQHPTLALRAVPPRRNNAALSSSVPSVHPLSPLDHLPAPFGSPSLPCHIRSSLCAAIHSYQKSRKIRLPDLKLFPVLVLYSVVYSG